MSAAINTFVGNYTSTGKHDATPKISISLHAGCVVRWHHHHQHHSFVNRAVATIHVQPPLQRRVVNGPPGACSFTLGENLNSGKRRELVPLKIVRLYCLLRTQCESGPFLDQPIR